MSKKLLVSFLLVAVMLPAGMAQATIYTPYPGQSIDVAKTSLSPASVNVKLADLQSVSAQTFGISIFGNNYTLDVSTSRFLNAAGSPITLQSFAVGNRISVIGTLDVATPFLIHALVVRSLGTGTPPAGGVQPTVDLVANPTTVNPGATSVLTWTSTNATSCSGGVTGYPPSPRPLNQTPFSVIPIYETTSWSITCLGAPGTTPTTDTVTVTVTPPGGIAPTVNLTANPTTVNPGATSVLTWTSTNATSCRGGETGVTPPTPLDPSGSFVTWPLNNTTSFTIICDGAPGTTPATDTVTVTVASPGSVSCSGPTTAVVNTPITFTASGGSGAYTWTPGQGTASGSGYTLTFSSPGAQTVTTISSGQTATCNIQITGGDGGTPGSTTGICATGGQFAGGIGIERPLGNAVVNVVRIALGCYSVRAFEMPSGATHPDGASINHRFLWNVWNYGAAMHAGNNQYKISARATLIDFLDNQRVYGHYTIPNGGTEILNSSHYQIWSNAGAAARLLAFVYNDAAMLNATGRWWRAEKALWDTLEHGGSIDAPGGRFRDVNNSSTNGLRDVNYALLTNRNLPGNASRATGPWWDQYYNVSAWMIRILLNRGDDLGGARNAGQSDIPLLPYPLCIYNRGSDYVHYFPNMPNTYEPLRWVANIGGDKSRSNPLPPPALPGATLTVLPGKTGSSSNCPATL